MFPEAGPSGTLPAVQHAFPMAVDLFVVLVVSFFSEEESLFLTQ